jgi:glucan biosynthesis protein C
MTTSGPARDHGLDAVRAVLLMLGVALHSAAVYTPDGHWLVTDPEHDPIFGLINDAIHSFRMPAFFWLSGYFTAMAMLQSDPRGYIWRRYLRIGVPLVATWALVNPIQLMLVPAGSTMIPSGPDNVPLFHLWFLVDLLVFTSFALVAMSGGRLLSIAALLPSRGIVPLGALFALLAWFLSAAVRASGLAYDEPLGLTSAARLASGLPFFAAGLLMHPRADFTRAYMSIPGYLWIATIPVLLWLKPMAEADADVISEPAILASLFVTYITIGSVMRCLKTVLAAVSVKMRFWSDASYTVYLFHHLVVMIVAIWLIPYTWPVPIKFALVFAVGLGLPAILHQVAVRRSRVLAFLFNGKLGRSRPTTSKLLKTFGHR